MRSIAAGKFKAQCLALLDEVARTHTEIVVTKYGRPVACVCPYEGEARGRANPLKGSIVSEKDILAPVDADWDVLK
jgi:prevent-host-death family protein